MIHYRKGKNVEQALSKTDLPFEDCMPKGEADFLWMHVKGGTKIHNVVKHARKALNNGEYRTMVWSGSGGGVTKTISCAEVMKRSYPLYQVTRTSYIKVEEHWKPLMEGLEEIVATRQIPSVHILLTLNPLDDEINGLQKPKSVTQFWEDVSPSNSRPTKKQPKHQNQHQRQDQNKNQHQGQNEQQAAEESAPGNKANKRKRQRQRKRNSDSTKPSSSATTEQPDKQDGNPDKNVEHPDKEDENPDKLVENPDKEVKNQTTDEHENMET